MTDRTSGSGGDRHRPQRLSRGDEWTPEQESEQRDAWAPGDAVPGRRTPRGPLPEERLPGEPGAGRSGGGGVAQGPGREGLTGDDRTPQDTPQPPPGPAGGTEPGRSESGWAEDAEPAPGPAGSPASATSAAATGPGSREYDPRHGSEGLRPGTEEPGPQAPGSRGQAAQTYGGGDRQAGGPERAGEEEGVMPDNGLGAPSAGEVSGREARMTEAPAADSWPAAPGGTAAPGGSATGTGTPLLPHEETEQWERRLREVVAGFVDEPRQAVEEADRTLEEIAARFTEAVTRRRRTLRTSWEGTEGRGPAVETGTEQLRLALRDYRELAGRLLHG
ncbi:hypothetical protein [Streptomyces sp. NPDC046870]|uniref:hypothetical protein n=1 Tax=Streptomyces sp. NPDC046870 TaxID=3155135 RepID=UPI003453CF6A